MDLRFRRHSPSLEDGLTMGLLSRIGNVFRPDRLRREVDEELADHLACAAEEGRGPAEARRALGNAVRHREASMDIRMAGWLDALRSDVLFGIRQLRRRPVITAAAIVSLALAIGAVTSAFRLIDAALLRPLPVADPHSLFVITYSFVNDVTSKADEAESFSYPQFVELREAVKGKAELMVVSYSSRVDLTYGGDDAMERGYRQMVSGSHFRLMGLQPALGRLLSEADDKTPGGHPVAVISHDYWTRRFGQSPKAVGQTFRLGTVLYEIVGVLRPGYTGTETGVMTDFYIPAMQNADAIREPGWQWMRVWARLAPGAEVDPVRQALQASLTANRRERVKLWPADTPKEQLEQFVHSRLELRSAAAGVSSMQRNYRRPLWVLGAVVLLVLLIACTNVANLLTAQAAAREKEMALRVSIGAGRGRLVQLMLVECLLLAGSAAVLGGLFAWWSAPFVVRMINPPEIPARLHLPADWRVLGFSVLLALLVTVLFGMAPALRASGVKPASALKGGDDPHARRRLMNVLVAAQVAFCFLVHFVAGLFISSFERLSNQPTGFATNGVVLLETQVKGNFPANQRPQQNWEEIREKLRGVPGVQKVALSSFALMGSSSSSVAIRIANRPPDTISPYLLGISRGWLDAMEIRLLSGRDFTLTDRWGAGKPDGPPVESRVIVNEAFARRYFDGQDPVGKSFETHLGKQNQLVRNEIVGYVRDARYRDLREPIRPTIYAPMGESGWGTFAVRTEEQGAVSQGAALRRIVSEARPEFRVVNVRMQADLVREQTLRERLLATLSLFFAAVALILAAVGLYGVLNYAVVQRRREIGIRIALGARSAHVARQVSGDVFVMLLVGSAFGLGAGLAGERFVESLLYEVKGTDLWRLATPALTLLGAALLAAIPPVFLATRTDPATALRNE